ncbi:hypothetical protein Glove_216g76 [Diversispora epigaea]|uniref:Uncharacterized protein n=1 Tax=Diversispora epigaea TaxID=1348612 RepID=A0A397ING9_9GLOM|nr:hypothetical protein Glove_216g76 [Diversispora epigaea]
MLSILEATVVNLTLASHRNWVSSVSWSTQSPNILVSGSYDASLKIWDIRSKTPLYTLQIPSNEENKISDKKILCVDWDFDVILSGGEDEKLHVYSAKNLS